MSFRIVAVVVLALVTSACSFTRTGETVPALAQTLGPPKDGTARVIVFRENAFSGLADIAWPVDLDGQRLGDLKTGTFAYRDCVAGRHALTDAKWDMPGVSRLEFDASSGSTYIFVIRTSDLGKGYSLGVGAASVFGLAVAGVAAVAGNAATDIRNSGGFVFVPVDDASAGRQLADIHLVN